MRRGAAAAPRAPAERTHGAAPAAGRGALAPAEPPPAEQAAPAAASSTAVEDEADEDEEAEEEKEAEEQQSLSNERPAPGSAVRVTKAGEYHGATATVVSGAKGWLTLDLGGGSTIKLRAKDMEVVGSSASAAPPPELALLRSG